MFIKRIKGDLFFDYASSSYRILNESEDKVIWAKTNLSSFGVELTADFHLLRMEFPFNSGVRIGYSPFTSDIFYQVIFGIDLFNN